MARLASFKGERKDERNDERGAVYVEFLIAFFPLFLIFLAICQLALIAAAEVVVRHAAYAGVRSAVVVLEDDPKKFGDTERGFLSKGSPARVSGIDDLASKLGIGGLALNLGSTPATAALRGQLRQQGARMVPIRNAALLPLVPLAPNRGVLRHTQDTVAQALPSMSALQIAFALAYARVATTVYVYDSPESGSYASEPIGRKSPVTVRVNYLFHCGIPLVRAMLCGPVPSIASPDRETALIVARFSAVAAGARFKLLTASATLPNQGAEYY